MACLFCIETLKYDVGRLFHLLVMCLRDGSRRFQRKFGRKPLIILKVGYLGNRHEIIPFQRSKPLGIGKRQPVVKGLKR